MAVIQIQLTLDRKNLDKKLERLRAVPGEVEDDMQQIAIETLGRLVDKTPYRYYGAAKKGWVHRVLGPMRHLIINTYQPVIKWLERGTKAHGPKTAKALFIPLTQKAAEAGPRGVMRENATAIAEEQWRSYARRASGKAPLRTRPRRPFEVGIDFVWAKRVRGIKPLWLAKKEQPVVIRKLKNAIKRRIVRATKA